MKTPKVLFCGISPQSLGIIYDGKWDYEAMKEHVAECEECQAGIARVRGMQGSGMTEKKLASCRKNAKKGGWPKGVPRKPRPLI